MSSRFRFPGGGLGIFLFTTASRTDLGPTQPPIQWVTGGSFPGVKRPGRKSDHSPPSSAEGQECLCVILPLSHCVFMAWCLVKHRDNFTFTLFLSVSDICGNAKNNYDQTV
jgi:hypothetical protein